MWANLCSHVREVDQFWKKDDIIQEIVEEFMIKFGQDSDDDCSDDEPENHYTGNNNDDSDLSDNGDDELLQQETELAYKMMYTQ